MQPLIISTKKKKEIIDITDVIQAEITKKSFTTGFCFLFIKHTTAALTTADLDPGTDLDMLDAFDGLIPKLQYRHPHNPAHVPDHIMSSLIGPSVIVPVQDGKLNLGTWQRIILIEFDGPRKREFVCSFLLEKDN